MKFSSKIPSPPLNRFWWLFRTAACHNHPSISVFFHTRFGNYFRLYKSRFPLTFIRSDCPCLSLQGRYLTMGRYECSQIIVKWQKPLVFTTRARLIIVHVSFILLSYFSRHHLIISTLRDIFSSPQTKTAHELWGICKKNCNLCFNKLDETFLDEKF